jgi:DNA-binding FrmR family transcriptional regulator
MEEHLHVHTSMEHDHDIKHEEALALLKTARGHLDAIIKMIEDERYCVDISTQLLAVIALLKKANTSVINKHIETCVKDAVKSGDVDQKLKELEVLMKYLEKSL